MTITDQTFNGLAFPVAQVRYNGDSSNWNASIRRDHIVYRARTSYNHQTGGGARGALPAARAALEKLLTDGRDGLAREGDYVAIPGDLNNETYTFTFVPVEILARNAGGLQLSQDAQTFIGLLVHTDIDSTTDVYATNEIWEETRRTFPVDPDQHTAPADVYVIR